MERTILQCWLGENLVDHSGRNESAGRSLDVDCMMLALRTSGREDLVAKMSLAQRLRDEGDMHLAAALHISMGQTDAATGMYISSGLWMEAILLAALHWPQEWQRIAGFLRGWTASMLAECDELRGRAARCISSSEIKPKQHWAPLSSKYAAFLPKQERRSEDEDVAIRPLSSHGKLPSPDGVRTASTSSRISLSPSMVHSNIMSKPRLKVVTDLDRDGSFAHQDDVFTDTAKYQPTSQYLTREEDISRSHKRGQSTSSIRSDTPAQLHVRSAETLYHRNDSHHRPPPKFQVERLRAQKDRIATPIPAARDDPYRIRTRSDSKPSKGYIDNDVATPSRSNSKSERYQLVANGGPEIDGMIPKALHVRSPPSLPVGGTASDQVAIMPDVTESTVTIETIDMSSPELEEAVPGTNVYNVSDLTANTFYSQAPNLSLNDIMRTGTPGGLKSSLILGKSSYTPPIRRAESCRPDVDRHRQQIGRQHNSSSRGDGFVMQGKVSFQELH
jgi:hypothetical protein